MLLCLSVSLVQAQGLTASRLAVLYNPNDSSSRALAAEYAALRGVPTHNLVEVPLPAGDVMRPETFASIRKQVLDHLPLNVQALLLVWTTPYAVGCMSVTTAFAAGYRPGFCEPGCARTIESPLFDTDGWLPADTVGWWPAMMLPSAEPALSSALIRRGIAADASRPPGTLYLIHTQDAARNVRAAQYRGIELELGPRLGIEELSAPINIEIKSAIGYFTGVTWVDELKRVQFRPGAPADHLTSAGGVLKGGHQMAALEWLRQGATGSFGTVSEPCNHLEKFPDIEVLFKHYLRGETLLESYWKSVRMPGQGLILGEPLARPFASAH